MGSPLERFDHSPFEYNSRLFTNHEPRLFLGLRCGVPPRQTQTNNDASGNPQRVAGRPPFLFVRVTALHLTGQRLWASPTESHTGDGNECRPQKNTRPTALCVGDALKAFLARQVPTSGRRKTVAKTDSCGWRPVVRFGHTYSCMMVGFYEPRAIIFSRAEGHSRQCSQFEFVVAKRHLSPRRPATGGAVGPKIKKFKFFCFFRRNLHPRVEYYTYKGRDHKE